MPHHHLGLRSKKRGFTLIELLIVLGIVAVLAVIIIVVLNPAEYFRRSRDVKRQTDLQSLNHAIVLATGIEYSLDLGTSSTVYISLADGDPGCASWGLPALPGGWVYHCVPTADLQKIDGSGWIPIDFQSLVTGPPLANLPIDPVNTSSSGLYYTYNIGGSWKLTAAFESVKFQTLAQADGGIDPEIYEAGTTGIAPTLARGGAPAPTGTGTPTPTPAETPIAETNIDGTEPNHWAWNDDIGWLDFYATHNVKVYSDRLEGYATSSVGYIVLNCKSTPNDDICAISNFAVSNDGSGNLAGWAYNDGIGWISFCGSASGGSTWNAGDSIWECPASPTYEVTIDGDGNFHGWAWNEIAGWMSFNCLNSGTCGTHDFKVKKI